VVVYDEQVPAAGLKRDGVGGASLGGEGRTVLLERGGEPQFDLAVLSAGGRELSACRVERDAGDWGERGQEGAGGLFAAGRVPQLNGSARGSGR
jgi:hypothetical protein